MPCQRCAACVCDCARVLRVRVRLRTVRSSVYTHHAHGLVPVQGAHAKLRAAIETAAAGVAAAHGVEAEVDFLDAEVHTTAFGDTWTTRAYPPVVNSPALVGLARRTVEGAFGAAAWREMDQLMIGEDFAFFCEVVPCVAMLSGHRAAGHAPGERTGTNHHAPTFEVRESARARACVRVRVRVRARVVCARASLTARARTGAGGRGQPALRRGHAGRHGAGYARGRHHVCAHGRRRGGRARRQGGSRSRHGARGRAAHGQRARVRPPMHTHTHTRAF